MPMTTNPFISPTRNPIVEDIGGQYEGEPALASLSNSDSERSGGEFGIAQHERRFLKRVGFSSVVFLVLVFSVFREVKHSRELFQINRLVAVAEAQRRQWQELQRLDEAREACLMAEVLRLQSLPRDTQIVKASDNIPARRR
jgi:hypothetical protein